MDLSGSREIAAPPEVVWRGLNDPETLRKAIPGCETLTKLSDNEFEATAGVAIGPVKAKFKGKVRLADLNPPTSYTISGEGQGGVAGFAKGEAKVSLAPITGGTRLDYDVKAQVGGKLAQVGQRLIDGAAKKWPTSSSRISRPSSRRHRPKPKRSPRRKNPKACRSRSGSRCSSPRSRCSSPPPSP